jgi:hypothetical protein
MLNEMTQIKFTIEADIVSAFKARCALDGVSMTAVIRQWMIGAKPQNATGIKTDTRPRRRKIVLELNGILENLLQGETEYRDAIPEVFEARRDIADWACGKLEEAISSLEEAF